MRCQHVGPTSYRLIAHAHFPWLFIYSKQMLPAFAVVGRNHISLDSSYRLAIGRMSCAFCATHANQFKYKFNECVDCKANMCSYNSTTFQSEFLRMHHKNWNESISCISFLLRFFSFFRFIHFMFKNLVCGRCCRRRMLFICIVFHSNRWVCDLVYPRLKWCLRRKCDVTAYCTHGSGSSGNKLPK